MKNQKKVHTKNYSLLKIKPIKMSKNFFYNKFSNNCLRILLHRKILTSLKDKFKLIFKN